MLSFLLFILLRLRTPCLSICLFFSVPIANSYNFQWPLTTIFYKVSPIDARYSFGSKSFLGDILPSVWSSLYSCHPETSIRCHSWPPYAFFLC